MPDRDPLRGFDLLQDSALNKSTGFTEEERECYGLRGLLPPRVLSQKVQLERVMASVRRKPNDIERYIFLFALQGRNARLYYKAVIEHIDELLPIVYTPTVGQACLEFAINFRQTRGFYVTPQDKGRIRRNLDNWPENDVRVIVVTDGERILGLGDLGANGMGIPIGKLALYVACAGIHPRQCLPVMLDVGTRNITLRNDPLYLGVPDDRLTGTAYDELVEEFVLAVQDRFPNALIQFEDFLTPNAYKLLDRYRDRILCFNDDIQGTAAVVLGGVYASTRISGQRFKDMTIMFLGVGSAAIGIGDLVYQAFCAEGLSARDARRRLWFVDVDGLVVASRRNLDDRVRPYAHDHAPMGFEEAIRALRPNLLIGATGVPGTFTEEAVRLMAEINGRPGIFALSNPTSRAECTALEAYEWTDGRAIYASGSPFPPVVRGEMAYAPGQANNVYVFPGIGLGALCSGSRHMTDEMFLVAARTLADHVDAADLQRGSVYPSLRTIRDVSRAIAVNVASIAYNRGLTSQPRRDDLEDYIASLMFDPTY